jgi:hypothetical protein
MSGGADGLAFSGQPTVVQAQQALARAQPLYVHGAQGSAVDFDFLTSHRDCPQQVGSAASETQHSV